MDDGDTLRAMWEFPATWKLLTLLSQPLSFSPPTSTVLEAALLSPSDHISVLANCHGRLLGLSIGTSASKKWMQTTARFVRQRPEEFTFLSSDVPELEPLKLEQLIPNAKEEPLVNPADAVELHMSSPAQDAPAPSRPFPTNENDYFRLRPGTRLLVLHTIAELVMSEHDSLLSAGTIAEINFDELRCFPIASDAVGNNYWYFGDFERVYREPSRPALKTRRQIADDNAKMARRATEKAAEEAAKVEAAREQEEKRVAVEKKQEEIRQKREERVRKRREKWAPRVAATRTTRASRKAADSVLATQTGAPGQHGTRQRSDDHQIDIDSNPSHSNYQQDAKQDCRDDDDDSDDNYMAIPPPTRRSRVSERTRKREPEPDQPSLPVRTLKRPRKVEPFADPALRTCLDWQVFSHNGDRLKDAIDRFRTNAVVLPSERALVRRLEEGILPEIFENEEKLRKELERIERKKRNELLLSTFSNKRSSRVQALTQKREEEAKRIAEEEERESRRLQRIADHDQIIKSQAALLEKEQSREIRIARRENGRSDAIQRDDELQRVAERKSRQRETPPVIEDVPVRRSRRAQRASQRISDILSEDIKGASTAEVDSMVDPAYDSSTPAQGTSELGEIGNTRANRDATVELADLRTDSRGVWSCNENVRERSVDSSRMGSPTVATDVPAQDEAERDTEILSSTNTEAKITDEYTWLKNRDDGQPIRVLDRFFFASQTGFSDAPLEACDEEGSHVIGFGILIPPASSTSDAIRVKIPRILEWVIEYGAAPKIWVRSEVGWYELREPAVEYRDAFSSAKKKFEICIRISILGYEMRTAQLSYESIIDLLSYRYEGMMSYREEDIVQCKRFIVSQMKALNRRSIVMSGFMKELQKRIKSEDSKAAAENRKTIAQGLTIAPSLTGSDYFSGHEQAKKKAEEEGVQVASVLRRQARRRASAGGQRVVPRAVSSIITSLLKDVTKSVPRHRKRKMDASRDRHVSDFGESMRGTNGYAVDTAEEYHGTRKWGTETELQSGNLATSIGSSPSRLLPNGASPSSFGHSIRNKSDRTVPNGASRFQGVQAEEVSSKHCNLGESTSRALGKSQVSKHSEIVSKQADNSWNEGKLTAS